MRGGQGGGLGVSAGEAVTGSVAVQKPPRWKGPLQPEALASLVCNLPRLKRLSLFSPLPDAHADDLGSESDECEGESDAEPMEGGSEGVNESEGAATADGRVCSNRSATGRDLRAVTSSGLRSSSSSSYTRGGSGGGGAAARVSGGGWWGWLRGEKGGDSAEQPRLRRRLIPVSLARLPPCLTELVSSWLPATTRVGGAVTAVVCDLCPAGPIVLLLGGITPLPCESACPAPKTG